MTDFAGQSFNDALVRTAQHQQLQMWRAAETVRSHVKPNQQREVILECLGLTDVVRPDSP